MKTLFALDEENTLVGIDSVDKNFKKKYSCCNCNGELIPRKGKVNKHHFAHKSDSNCSYETYLHKVSKLKFFEVYTECLKTNTPFYIQYDIYRTCNSCEDLNIRCNLSDLVEKYDLTRVFDKISIEKKVEGFIADILLESSKSNEHKLLIEFAVTHLCEENKIDSGLKIIEIKLKTEDDLYFLNKKLIPFGSNKMNYFNFKKKLVLKNHISPNECKESFDLLYIKQNNKAWSKEDVSISEIRGLVRYHDYKDYRIERPSNNEWDYDRQGKVFMYDFISKYAHKDKTFKNCLSCRFSVANNKYRKTTDLFCKKNKEEIITHNKGNNCPHHWLIQKKT